MIFLGYAECKNILFEILNCTRVILVSKYQGPESFSHTVLTFPTGGQKGAEGTDFNSVFRISFAKMEPEAAIINTFTEHFSRHIGTTPEEDLIC